MLNSNTKEIVNIISMPIDPTYKVISAHKIGFDKELFIMTSISELECKKLEALNDLNIVRGDFKFHIIPDNVVCYGNIDFHEGSEDCDQLDTFNWLEHLNAKGIPIPSNYNYDKHECTTNKKFILWIETFKNSVLCRYLHGCLGKPKFTLIFRELK